MRRRHIKKRKYIKKKFYGKGRFSTLNKLIRGGFKFFNLWNVNIRSKKGENIKRKFMEKDFLQVTLTY